MVDNDAAPEENGEGEGYEYAADEANGNGEAQDGDWEEGEGGEEAGGQQGAEGEEIDEEIEQMAVEELEREIGKVRRQIVKLETDLENEDDSGLLSLSFALLADNCSIHSYLRRL